MNYLPVDSDDAFFKVCAVLLHDDDGFVEEVFFVDLSEELLGDGLVGDATVGEGELMVGREGWRGRTTYGSDLLVTAIGVLL